jgi:hypothetical protein
MALVVLGVNACGTLLPSVGQPVSLPYDSSPRTIVITALSQTRGGGPLPGESCNYLPDLRVWGDGRIIRVTYSGNRRLVTTGHLSPDQVERLLTTLSNQGFFTSFASDPPNPAATGWWLTVQLQVVTFDRFSNAPRSFYVSLLATADGFSLAPYVPDRALLETVPESQAATPLVNLLKQNGISFQETSTGGTWLTGPALTAVWTALNGDWGFGQMGSHLRDYAALYVPDEANAQSSFPCYGRA